MHGLYPNDASWLDSAGRLLIVAFFVIVWLRNLSAITSRITSSASHSSSARCRARHSGPAWCFESVGCVLVLVNWHPAIGVLCLIVFTVLATLLLLRFWEMDDPMKRMGMQNGFLANIAVLGGLLLLLQNVT